MGLTLKAAAGRGRVRCGQGPEPSCGERMMDMLFHRKGQKYIAVAEVFHAPGFPSAASISSSSRRSPLSSNGLAPAGAGMIGSFTRWRTPDDGNGAAKPRRNTSAATSRNLRPSRTARNFISRTKSSGKSRVVFMNPAFQLSGFPSSIHFPARATVWISSVRWLRPCGSSHGTTRRVRRRGRRL